jgi:lipopolysaccharide export system permease protein
MRHYERYLMTSLIWPTVLITASLTGVVWLSQVLRFVDFMLNRGLTVSEFLYLTGLMLPQLLMLILPIALVIAVLHTYYRLTSESELIVMNAVGLSKWQLARPMLLLAAVCLVICTILSAWLMPISSEKFRDIRAFFRDKYASMLLEEDVFNTPIDGVTVFLRERDSNNALHGILLHDSRNPKEAVTMMAERGRLEQTDTGPRFYLENGQRQQIKDGRVTWLSFDQYTLDIGFFAKDIARKRSNDELTLTELFTLTDPNPQKTAAMRAEGHERLIWPLFCVVLPLFALATMLGGEFNRRGQVKRVFEAAVLTLAVVAVFLIVRNLLVRHPGMAVSLYLMVAGVVVWSIYSLRTGRVPRLFQFFSLRRA